MVDGIVLLHPEGVHRHTSSKEVRPGLFSFQERENVLLFSSNSTTLERRSAALSFLSDKKSFSEIPFPPP